jgi:hypothetical protein
MIRMTINCYIVAFLGAIASAIEIDPRELQAEQQQYLQQLDSEIDGLSRQDSEDAIARLGEIFRKTSDESAFNLEERLEVHERSKRALLPKPGHATYYIEMLKRARANQLADEAGKEAPFKGSIVRYGLAKTVAFETLEMMPTPEAVKVIGGFLSDWEWLGYDGNPRDRMLESGEAPPNCVLAARALGNLLEFPPVKSKAEDYWFDEVEIWQLWYAQVETGNRTFRFKGDPQDYNLQGPVSKAIEPSEVRPRKDGGATDSTPAQTEKRQLAVPALVAAGSVLGAALWYVTRRRSSSQ